MIAQGTPEFFAQRLGHVTASMMSHVLAVGKSGEALTRKNYRLQLVAERMSGKVAESFSSSAIEFGIATEPLARMQYESYAGTLVDLAPFCTHPSIKWVGASPDGFVNDGLLEIKCPNTQTHLSYRLDNRCPPRYVDQIQCQLWCTERDWADFVSFDPRLPERLQLFVFRVQRDDRLIRDMEKETIKFLSEVEQTINKLEEIK